MKNTEKHTFGYGNIFKENVNGAWSIDCLCGPKGADQEVAMKMWLTSGKTIIDRKPFDIECPYQTKSLIRKKCSLALNGKCPQRAILSDWDPEGYKS